MRRISFPVVTLVAVGALAAMVGCQSGDTVSTGAGGSKGSGGSSSTGGTTGTGGTPSTGGLTGTGGTPPATGGVIGTGGTPSTGGVTGTGGTPSTGGTTGTAGAKGTGGTPSTGGTTGTGGTKGTGGTPGTGGTTTATGGTPGTAGASGFGQPACGNTAAGTAIAKGVTCTATDTALCYKTCGPEKTGVKSETCPAGGGTYTEMTGCSFDPSKDFSCYKIPTTPDAACPTTVITAGSACAPVADCVVCGGTTGYIDSTGAAKTGYCVCQAAASSPTWSCSSNTAWPCPTGTGC